MPKTIFSREYTPAKIEDKAELTDSQIRGIENSSSMRLNPNLTYVVARQFAHKSRRSTDINGHIIYSNKVFVVGVNNEGYAVQGIELSINSLRQLHFGRCVDSTPLIEAEKRDGLWRAKHGLTQSAWKNGSSHIKFKGKYAYIDHEFAFKVIDRYRVGFPQFKKKDGEWDMITYEKDGKTYLDLAVQTINEYEEVYHIPEVNWNECIPELQSKGLQVDLPE